MYLEATAGPAEDTAHAVDLLNARLPDGKHLEPADLEPAGPLRVYAATVTQHYVLVRGGDPDFDTITDTRLAVAPP